MRYEYHEYAGKTWKRFDNVYGRYLGLLYNHEIKYKSGSVRCILMLEDVNMI